MFDVYALLPKNLNNQIISLVKECEEIYLVGGAIRNALLGDSIQDFDFVVKKNSILAAKTVANKLNGAFYILDHKRETARAIITVSEKTIHVDFSLLNGNRIDEDLRKRDFTMNAIALRFPLDEKSALIDPLKGVGDLKSNQLRPCSAAIFIDDPVRTIRAVRFANEYQLTINGKTKDLISQAAGKLDQISPERKRDELLKVFEKTSLSQSLNLLDELDIFSQIFPVIAQLKPISLSPPHTHDALAHTFRVAAYTQDLSSPYLQMPKKSHNHMRIDSAQKMMERYQLNLTIIFSGRANKDRSIISLLFLAALFHDSGKAVVKPVDDQGRKRFPKHAKFSGEIAEEWAREYGFSNAEIKLLKNMVRYHMKPSKLDLSEKVHSNLQLHRFYNKSGKSGVWIVFLHLADVLATYEEGLTDERWSQALFTANKILDAYFLNYQKIIQPKRLLDGNEISQIIGGTKGKIIGNILGKLAEAQVAGEINTKSEAIKFVEEMNQLG